MIRLLSIFIMWQFLTISPIYAQDFQKIDSLEHVLKIKTEQNPFDTTICKLLDTLFARYEYRNFNKAKQIAEQALQIGKHHNNYKILERWNRKIGFLYLQYEIYWVSIDYYLKGLEYAEKRGTKGNWWYIELGNIYFADKNYEKAAKNYKKALENFSKDMSKDSINAIIGIAVAYSNLGLIFQKKQMHDSSMFQFKKSLAIREKLSDNNSKVFICNQIAVGYLLINKFDSAEKYLKKALYFDEKTETHTFLSDIGLLNADMFIKQNKYALAYSKLQEVEKFSIQYGDRTAQIKAYLRIIKILKKQTQYQNAIRYAQKAILLGETTGNRQNSAFLYKEVSNMYKELNNSDSAFKYLAASIKVKDSLDSLKHNSIEQKFEIELNKVKLNNTENKLIISNQKNTFYQYSSIAGIIVFILLTILLFFIIKGSKILKKSNVKITKQNNMINAQYEEIFQQNEEITTANNQLDEYKTHLEDKIKEQTKDVIEAKENAERADKLKTSFLENLSHEIRTPLNAIVGFSNLMEFEEGLSDNSKKFLDHINKGSNTLLRIIDSIMQVSNMQLGEFKLQTTTFNLYDLLQLLSSEFKNAEVFIKKDQVQFKTKFDIEPNTSLKSDSESLKTILSNLIDNAIKFTEKGIIELGVSKGEKDQIRFYVKDTGIGIVKEDIKFIFDKFRKVEPNKSKLYRGLGLGLTVAKSLVEQLGGKIWLESEINKGSAFYFTIPISKKTTT